MAPSYDRSRSAGRWQSTKEEHETARQAMSDLLGVQVSLHEDTQPAAGAVTTVKIGRTSYQVQNPPKQFYRDLTYLDDHEIIHKYRLTPCNVEEHRTVVRKSGDNNTEKRRSRISSAR